VAGCYERCKKSSISLKKVRNLLAIEETKCSLQEGSFRVDRSLIKISLKFIQNMTHAKALAFILLMFSLYLVVAVRRIHVT
jgi:hypothetical protein